LRADGEDSEYRLTAYPSYPINDSTNGFGYLGYVSKQDADYNSYYLGSGVFHSPREWLELWGGLIGVATDNETTSDLLEVRPFVGIKFRGANARKWHYYNWTRYELRLTETRDTDEWSTVHRFRNQTKLEIPLGSFDRAWTPQSWFAFVDAEAITRSDTGQIDPVRLRAALSYIASRHVVVELSWWLQYTRPDEGDLEYTDNIFRLNFKILTGRGLLSGMAPSTFDD
jgi:hypothetical protein